jgi:hypothetical protein
MWPVKGKHGLPLKDNLLKYTIVVLRHVSVISQGVLIHPQEPEMVAPALIA